MMTTTDGGELQPPEGVEARWDLDGIDITLPGAGLARRDVVNTLGWLGGFLGLIFFAMTRWASWAQGTMGSWEMWVGLLCVSPGMPLFVSPFIFLGALRARGTPIRIRIEPEGAVTHQWMGEIATLRVEWLTEVQVIDDGQLRLELLLDRHPRRVVWRVREREQADWLAAQLRAAMSQRAVRQGSESEAPSTLARLTGRQTE